MLADNRIKQLEELQEMRGRHIWLCWNAFDRWSAAKTQFSDVRLAHFKVDVLLSPTMMATPEDPIHYGPALKKRTTYLMLKANPLGKAHQATLVRLTDFNFNGRYNASKWWGIFRTQDEAELQAVHASLSISARCHADQKEIMLALDLFSVFKQNIEPTLLGLTPFVKVSTV